MKQWFVCAGLLFSAGGQAEVGWSDFSLTYLNGQHYRIGDHQRQVYTFEYAARTSWGDSFLFMDHLRSANGDRENYGEWAPRFSLTKAGAISLHNALLQDVLIAGQVEMSETTTNYLYGVGFAWQVPGFKYVSTNFYRRDNDNVKDNWQTTIVWGLPWQLGDQQFLWDGFVDWTSSTRDKRSSMNWTSQLKWLVSPLLGIDSRLYLGVEYALWRNKFGIPDSSLLRTHESNMSVLVKWHF